MTLQGKAASTAEVATGYCKGTPLRAGIEARGDLEAVTKLVTNELELRLGPGPVTGSILVPEYPDIGRYAYHRELLPRT